MNVQVLGKATGATGPIADAIRANHTAGGTPFLDAPAPMDVKSNDPADTGLALVRGLTEDAVPFQEELVLNGTTAVPILGGASVYRVNRLLPGDLVPSGNTSVVSGFNTVAYVQKSDGPDNALGAHSFGVGQWMSAKWLVASIDENDEEDRITLQFERKLISGDAWFPFARIRAGGHCTNYVMRTEQHFGPHEEFRITVPSFTSMAAVDITAWVEGDGYLGL